MSVATVQPPVQVLNLPAHREPYYAGKWQKPAAGRYAEVTNPATAKAYTLTVSTTADTTAVTSASYTVTGAKGVSGPSVAISPPSAPK